MGQKIILDSNILIYHVNDSLNLYNFISSGNFSISVVSKMEVLGYHKLSKEHEMDFKKLLDFTDIIPISENIVERVIIIKQQTKIGLADAIIAATCLENKASLMTANTKDFSKIPHLKLINPLQ